MRLPPVPTWVLAAATLAIYACDAQSSSVRSNVPVDAGHAPPPRADASFHGADAGAWAGDSAAAPILGQRVANVPARIFAVAPDESEILFIAGDGTLSTVSPSGANPSQITSAATFLFLPNPITWMFLDPSPDGLSATVGAYHPGTSTVTAVVHDAAFRVLFPNPTTSRAIATTGFVVETGSSRTSTHTAGLIAVDADGGRRTTLLPRVNVGVWDDVRTRFSGRCSINAVWTSSTSAFVSVCVRDEEIRQLLSIDTLTGRTTTVALDVLSFLAHDPDGEFVLFADADVHLAAVSNDGNTVVSLDDPQPFTDLELLGGGRFAYTNAEGALQVASWPRMVPGTIQPFGARQLRGASPTGAHVLFSQTSAAISDLFLVGTSTPAADPPLVLATEPDAYPGDDAFSADGDFVYWYGNTNANGLGEVFSARTDGTTPPRTLGHDAFFVRNYSAADAVMLMVNARQAMFGQSQLMIADLAVRLRDARAPIQILVSGVHATDYAIFPSGNRVVYHIPDGHLAGLWVRDL